jgi:hypothetical protein
MNHSNTTVQQVWEKGQIINGVDPSIWRKDQCSAWINRNAYGDRSSTYGWEVDHISPGGSDNLPNLRPLHWKNNVAKSDGVLVCVVKSVGNENRVFG